MRQYIHLVKATPVLLTLLLTACAGSGHQLAAVSEGDLYRVKKEYAAEGRVFPVSERSDGATRKLVTKAMNRLLKNARPLCDYTGYPACFFQVIYSEGKMLNAQATNDYEITVYRGLLQFLQSEDEIASVIAHEMGHHLAHHGREKAQNAMVGSMLSGLVTAAVLGAANQDGYATAAQQRGDERAVRDAMDQGASWGALSYSVEEEREADLLGEYLLVRSGYSLKKAERVLWLAMSMGAAGGRTEDRSAFGDSHPAGPERIAAWRNVAEEIRNNPSKLPYKAKGAGQ